MVNSETRNNVIVASIIISISLITGSLIWAFNTNMEKTADKANVRIDKTAQVVTEKIIELVYVQEKFLNATEAQTDRIVTALDEKYTRLIDQVENNSQLIAQNSQLIRSDNDFNNTNSNSNNSNNTSSSSRN